MEVPPPQGDVGPSVAATPLSRLSLEGAEHPTRLWLKNDGLTSTLYGGNKVRKLARLLRRAHQRDARRLVTFGAAGSHHVLATTLFGKRAGFEVLALLTPQLESDHARDTLLAGLGAGLEVVPCSSTASLPWQFGKVRRRGDFVIAPGGMGILGSLGYVDAVSELQQQFSQLELPMADTLVVAAGTGSTAAGILAGLALHHIDANVIAVQVAHAPLCGVSILAQARAVLVRLGIAASMTDLKRHLSVGRGFIGWGYGWPTEETRAARAIARRSGLELDDTYTGKAFACAVGEADRGLKPRTSRLQSPRSTLYWHTLSAVSMEPLLKEAPSFAEVPASVRALFLPPNPGEPVV